MTEPEPLPPPWWHSAVVYQIYPRSFCDSNGDGIGDLPGVISKLDYLVELGVDIVWFSPFFRSPQVDNGYDISDYRGIDPIFGTLADADMLIEACHERGLKVLIDLVLNHTSDQHAWFIESRVPTSSKRDWYYWRPARAGFEPGAPGAEPTNWGSAFGGSAWEYDPESREYYLHLFAKEQPDLNWLNPAVREALFETVRWWVARGVDGFRLDVINLIGKPEVFADGYVEPGSALSYALPDLIDTERAHEFIAALHQEGWGDKVLFSVGEVVGVDVEEARRYTDPLRCELDMVITFEHMAVDEHGPKWALKDFSLPELKAILARWQHGLAEVGWNSLYWCNHDQPRIVSRWGDDSPEHRVASAKTWATILHCLRGTPFIYQGEELGMTNVPFASIEEVVDIEARGFFHDATAMGMDPETALNIVRRKGRDNARSPMQWDASPQAGFTTGEPWIPVNPNYTEINAAAAVADPASVWAHYRALIALRHELTILSDGSFELLAPDHERGVAYVRILEGQRLIVVANCSSEPLPLVELDLPIIPETGVRILGTHEGTSCEVLAPWESRVYVWT